MPRVKVKEIWHFSSSANGQIIVNVLCSQSLYVDDDDIWNKMISFDSIVTLIDSNVIYCFVSLSDCHIFTAFQYFPSVYFRCPKETLKLYLKNSQFACQSSKFHFMLHNKQQEEYEQIPLNLFSQRH